MTPDTGRERLLLRLGAITLPVADYQVLTDVPVLRDRLCDGETEVRLLPAAPCILKIRGAILQNECGAYLTALQIPLRQHRSYDTEFAGMQFTGLQITAAECSVKENGRIASLTVSLIGGLEA
ncbi:MAG: hypothetical protein IK134_05235 [Oscillospiraceae bacterium]|nr:hypothetical protein [Oscillospiraceae bacterium]MBQ9906441.1 hypothetical protein [Oscillospiraceae bacterium]MBR5362709.1 hypothetical protein [Oscillospiraceae bacterium]